MRDIKFRAFHAGKMKRVDQLFFNSTDGVVHGVGFGSKCVDIYDLKDHGIVLMQFTGLYDSIKTKECPNGREIFEGDIVQYQEGSIKDTSVGAIIFNYGKYWIQHDEWWSDLSLTFHHPATSNFEVIGNIYENPELLK
jgi:uncharacterized phage protein (TIGR01671 family)